MFMKPLGRRQSDAHWAGLLLGVAALLASPPVSSQEVGSDVPPPGRLIDVGGYRIHLWCTGATSTRRPTVVLSSGAGGFALDWALVQPALATSNRVCSYDRAGFGWSDPGPTPRTLRQEVAELHAALVAAREQAPFVMVGHSMGGLVVRLFAERHAEEIAGMVLVDATHESARLGYRGGLTRVRTLATGRRIPDPRTIVDSPPVPDTGEAAEACRSAAASATISGPYLRLSLGDQRSLLWLLRHPTCSDTGEDYLPEELADLHGRRKRDPSPLGVKPLLVLAGMLVSAPPGVDRAEWLREKLDERSDLARLSRIGRLVTDTLSGHFIQLENPSLVVESIGEVVRATGRR